MLLKKAILGGLAGAAIALSLGASACAGDDDSSTGAVGGGGTGSDEKYVATVCSAFKDFSAALDDLGSKAATAKNEDDLAKLVVAPLENVTKALKGAKPPADVKTSHDGLVKNLEEAVADVKKNGAKATKFDSLSAPVLPADVSARLDKEVAKNKDCAAAGFTFQ